jgi:hypothetical protein
MQDKESGVELRQLATEVTHGWDNGNKNPRLIYAVADMNSAGNRWDGMKKFSSFIAVPRQDVGSIGAFVVYATQMITAALPVGIVQRELCLITRANLKNIMTKHWQPVWRYLVRVP